MASRYYRMIDWLRAVWLFARIVWRPWETWRISPSVAWSVARGNVWQSGTTEAKRKARPRRG